MTESIENRTFDEIQIGDAASVTRALRPEDVETWAAVTGNLNLIDLDPTSLDSSMFPYGAGQASWAAALFSAMADTRLPGLGSVTVSADIHFLKPVPVGEELTATLTIKGKRADEGIVVLDCVCTRQRRPGAGRRHARGEGTPREDPPPAARAAEGAVAAGGPLSAAHQNVRRAAAADDGGRPPVQR